MKKTIISILFSIFCLSLIINPSCADSLKAGYGWYVDGTEIEAVKKSVSMMKENVSDPELVILYSTVGYDTGIVQENLRKEIGNAPRIFGFTSCWGVITKDGVHAGEKASLAILGLSSDAADFGVAGDKITESDCIENKAEAVTRKAIADSGNTPGSIPTIVLMGASPGIEEDVLKGIVKAVGVNIPVYGGSAADNTLEGNWKVFSNNNSYSSGFSIAVIFTDLKIGHAFHSGYLGSSKNAVATKVKTDDPRVLLELDNRPAAEVYNEWAYDKFDEQLNKGGSILGPASFYPIAKKIQFQGQTHFIGIHPSYIDKETKALSLFANIKKGERLYFTEGTPDALIYRPRTIVRRALVSGRIKKKIAGVGFLIYCGGTMLAVQDRIKEIVPIINKAIGNTPYIGAFTFGEQGNIEGYGNFHGNLMCSIVVMGK
jgi:hypothetical protein